ncbi:MAG TPA: hypothetical protein VF773_21455 [Verrucomicrobiae bacterium]
MKLILVAFWISALPACHSAIWHFDLGGQGGSGLLGANVVDHLGDSIATGKEIPHHEVPGILYDDVQKVLEFHVGWGSHEAIRETDLRGLYVSSGLHGPASMTENANGGPVYSFTLENGYQPLNDPSGKTGQIHAQLRLADIGSYTVAQQEADLLGSRFYFSIASTFREGGEIRGQLLRVIPEPAHYGVAIGLLVFGWAIVARTRNRPVLKN